MSDDRTIPVPRELLERLYAYTGHIANDHEAFAPQSADDYVAVRVLLNKARPDRQFCYDVDYCGGHDPEEPSR